MQIIKIGNWIIKDDGIHWAGQPETGLVIEKERLNEGGPGDRVEMYDWLVHLPTKTWLTNEDIYALNTALIYALEYFDIGFDNNLSFVKTFIEQQKEMITDVDDEDLNFS